MFGKWIECEVKWAQRSAFSKAQETWSEMATCKGFLGQCGGFDGNTAKILNIWERSGDYDTFMLEMHDRIAVRNSQARHYVGIRVMLLESVALRPLTIGEWNKVLEDSELMRSRSVGLDGDDLGGYLARFNEDWHSDYSREGVMVWSILKGCNQFLETSFFGSASGKTVEMQSSQTNVIPLEKTWTVLPS